MAWTTVVTLVVFLECFDSVDRLRLVVGKTDSMTVVAVVVVVGDGWEEDGLDDDDAKDDDGVVATVV